MRALLGVTDDEATNTLVVAEHDTLSEFWQDDEQNVRAWSITLEGQAPESAIQVDDLAKARLMLLRVECCEQSLFRGELAPSTVRYGDGQLTVYRAACTGCDQVQSRYFKQARRLG